MTLVHCGLSAVIAVGWENFQYPTAFFRDAVAVAVRVSYSRGRL